MKKWILSLGIVVIIVAIISLILPEGKLGKYIKSICSLIVILAVLQPLLNLKQIEVNFNTLINGNDATIQVDFINYISGAKIKEYEKNCNLLAENVGLEYIETVIEYSINDDAKIVIKKVNLNLKDAVIISDKEHIDIIEEVIDAVAKYLNVNKEIVVVYE